VARRFRVPLHVRSSFNDSSGTVVEAMERIETDVVHGVACDPEVATLVVSGMPAGPAGAAALLEAVGEAGIRTLLVLQAPSSGGGEVAILLQESDLPRAEAALRPLVAAAGATLRADAQVAAVSVVGHAIHSHPGTTGRILAALAGVQVEWISSSSICLTCVVPRAEARRAQVQLHAKLGLGGNAVEAAG